MKEVAMSLDCFVENYVMHCSTKEYARLFCEFLYENGRSWRSGDSYLLKTAWENYEEDTVYFFNEGTYGRIDIAEESGYSVLEIEDFILEV